MKLPSKKIASGLVDRMIYRHGVEVFADSLFAGLNIAFERSRDFGREIDLWLGIFSISIFRLNLRSQIQALESSRQGCHALPRPWEVRQNPVCSRSPDGPAAYRRVLEMGKHWGATKA
jgi:hypothetical protein